MAVGMKRAQRSNGVASGYVRRSAMKSWCTMVAVSAALTAGAEPVGATTVLQTMVRTDITNLAPGSTTDTSSVTVKQQVYEGLVSWRADGSVAPMLAQSIDTSEDGKTYTFHLRKDVRFHNGKPLTSDAVKWTWNYYLDPANRWVCRSTFDDPQRIKIVGIDTPDPLTVVFHLANASGAFLSAMARTDCAESAIMHPDAMDPVTHQITKEIGTGPFYVKTWQQGQYILLDRFDQYRPRSEPSDGMAGSKKAEVDEVRINVIPDPATAILALRSGKIDILPDIPASQVPEFGGDTSIHISHATTAVQIMLLMEPRNPALADPRMRQAIIAALDTASMRQQLELGYGKANGSMVPMSSAYHGKVQDEGPIYSQARARALLKAAGYHGEPITITSTNISQGMSDEAVMIQAELAAVGINAKIQLLEFGAQLQRYLTANYQLMIWHNPAYLDPIFSFDRFIGAPSQLAKSWTTPAAQAALSDLYRAQTTAQKQAAFDTLHKLYLDDAPLKVWSDAEVIDAVRKNVHGFQSWVGLRPRYWNVSVTP